MPLDLPSGSPTFMAPAHAILKNDERCITYQWLSQRTLFGMTHQQLMPAYFDTMPLDSGVLIGSFIPSAAVVPGLTFPGDIDVLVIPYESDELVLSHTLAIEIKVVRASFASPGKSPNQFGFSQASALLAAGFPYVAVGHLIVSDDSPEAAWREVGMATVVNAGTGACELLPSMRYDMLPADLLDRSHGRLAANCPDPLLGYFAAYPRARGMWMPEGSAASHNPRASRRVMDRIHAYYRGHYRFFLRTRRHPPDRANPIFRPSKRELWRLLVEKMKRDF